MFCFNPLMLVETLHFTPGLIFSMKHELLNPKDRRFNFNSFLLRIFATTAFKEFKEELGEN